MADLSFHLQDEGADGESASDDTNLQTFRVQPWPLLDVQFEQAIELFRIDLGTAAIADPIESFAKRDPVTVDAGMG